MPPQWMTRLEAQLAEGDLAVGVVVLASMAGARVPLDEGAVHGATRRAVLLLAAGGDPARGLDLNGRAVCAVADDLDDPALRYRLDAELAVIAHDAAGLPHVSEAVRALRDDPDTAWRALACGLLAESLES